MPIFIQWWDIGWRLSTPLVCLGSLIVTQNELRKIDRSPLFVEIGWVYARSEQQQYELDALINWHKFFRNCISAAQCTYLSSLAALEIYFHCTIASRLYIFIDVWIFLFLLLLLIGDGLLVWVVCKVGILWSFGLWLIIFRYILFAGVYGALWFSYLILLSLFVVTLW